MGQYSGQYSTYKNAGRVVIRSRGFPLVIRRPLTLIQRIVMFFRKLFFV